MIEPIYCTQCGAEDFGCSCSDPQACDGMFCDVCGVHASGCGCGTSSEEIPDERGDDRKNYGAE